MRAIKFLVIFSLIFNSPFSFAVETSGGKGSTTGGVTSTGSGGTANGVRESILKKGKCPVPLKDSVISNLRGGTGASATVFFNTKAFETKQCSDAVAAYQDFLNKSEKNPQHLSAQLSRDFSSRISEDMLPILEGCMTSGEITPKQSMMAQSRFYASAARIENFNKTVLDEIAYLDSMTPGATPLADVECYKLMPDLKKNCESLKSLGAKCQSDATKRQDEQIDKTVDALKQIAALKAAEEYCKKQVFSGKGTKANCDNITKAIEVVRDDVPWIRGDTFDKLAQVKAKSGSPGTIIVDRSKVKDAMQAQIKENRAILASAYSDNYNNFRCLYNEDQMGSKCDIPNVRAAISNFDSPTEAINSITDPDEKTALQAEDCINEQGKTPFKIDPNAKIKNSGELTPTAGARVILGTMSRTKLSSRSGAFASSKVLDGILTDSKAKIAYQNCMAKVAPGLDKLALVNKQANMMCEDRKSKVNTSRTEQNECLVSALIKDPASTLIAENPRVAGSAAGKTIAMGAGVAATATVIATSKPRSVRAQTTSVTPVVATPLVDTTIPGGHTVGYTNNPNLTTDQNNQLNFYTAAGHAAGAPAINAVSVANGPIVAGLGQIDPARITVASKGQGVPVTVSGAGTENEIVATGKITGVTRAADGSLTAEITYQKPDGSMASQQRAMTDVYKANPALERKIAQMFLGAPQTGGSRIAPEQQAKSVTTASASPIDTRAGSTTNSMASAAAAPTAKAATVAQQATATQQRSPASVQTGSVSSGGGGGGSVASSGGGSSGRSIASVGNSSGSSSSYSGSSNSDADDLVAAFSAASSRNSGSSGSRGSSFAGPSSGLGSSFRGTVSAKQVLTNAKKSRVDKADDGVIDKTTNARFTEGEMIRVPKFENDKDADFQVVKKLDNGLLRVKDLTEQDKEFDLFRDEVKRAIRLSLNGAPDPLMNAKPVATPAKIGTNSAPGELLRAEKIDNLKLKEEFVRPGDQVTVAKADGGAALKARVVRKNPDGTVLVEDENGKEFDLPKNDVQKAEFSRTVPDDVSRNLNIVDDVGRVTAAQTVVSRPLTAKEEVAVIKSHQIAEEKGIYSLSKKELKEKTDVLRDAGFSDDEAKKLLQKGVTVGSGLDNIKIVSEQAATPKFDIVKGKQIQIPVRGSLNPGAVMSGPDKYGTYEVEYYEKGVGINRARKTAKELLEANVAVAEKVPNPTINVPMAGKDISYPGKVVSARSANGQYDVEVYPPGKAPTVITVSELDLKRANTPKALYEAQVRDARLANFDKKSSAELGQIVYSSLRAQKTLKTKRMDIEGQKALEELAKRQNREVKDLLAEMTAGNEKKLHSTSDIYNSDQAEGARHEINYLAQQDGLNITDDQRDSVARDLGIREADQVAAIEYGLIASRKDTRELFDRIFANQDKNFDAELLRRTMSYAPGSGYIGDREFTNAAQFVEQFKNADVSDLTLSERRLLNRFTDRAPLYARQENPDVPLIVRQNIEVNTRMAKGSQAGSRKIASVSEYTNPLSPRAQVEDANKSINEAREQLDFLAVRDGLKASRLTERQRETVARELGIYDESKTKALDYNSVGSKKEVNALFDKLFPSTKPFDVDLLRQTMSYNPRGGYLTDSDFTNATKFVNSIVKSDIDGSKLSLSERRLLNRFTSRAPLYAHQLTPETPTINPQSLEAVVPPPVTNKKVTTIAARGDEIVAQVNVKPEMVRKGDQVQLKNFEGGSDLNAYFVQKNKDGTVRVKDSRGKEFNLGQQATNEAKFYRGLTAELKSNGDLDPASRQKAAEGYVKRTLTQAQKDAVLSSYEVGKKESGFFDYTPEEQQKKIEILRKARFTAAEANLLLRKGVVGNNPKEFSQVIKVNPNEVRLGDHVNIDNFNGTGELRGDIVGSARNGGLILREENGAETIIYKSDIDDLASVRITRDAHRREIASDEEPISLEKTPVAQVNAKKAIPVTASEARVGDRVVINNFNGAGDIDAVIVNATKNGAYLVRGTDGSQTTVYKADLEDTKTAKISREWGIKTPAAKAEINAPIDFTADSPLLVSKDFKNNPDIVVPLGNGDFRQGRVVAKVEAKPGLPKAFTVEYADEAGILNQVNLTQEQLLAAANPEALKKIKDDAKRSSEYQAKTDVELRELLDEGHRAAKEALGKGRSVDKQDLNAESQTALAELARRNNVTSRSVFEAYRRGGIKGVEAIAQTTQNSQRLPASIAQATPVIDKAPLAQIKTGDFVVTAGIGEKIKLPKAVGTETEGVILAREKVDGEIMYSVGVRKSDKIIGLQKMSDREIGTVNPQFVGIKSSYSKNNDNSVVRSIVEKDFKTGKISKIDASAVVTADGVPYTNIDQARDENFAKLFQDVSQSKTGDLEGIKKLANKFATEKKVVIGKAKAAKLGSPNNLLRARVEDLQTDIENRQVLINEVAHSLDQIDESLGSVIAKDVGRSGVANMTIWELTLNQTPGKTNPAKVNFSTSVNMSRSEAVAQLREFIGKERIKVLSAQSRLDYDRTYLNELRTVVGVPRRVQPLNGGSLFVEAKNTSRNPASESAAIDSAANNLQTKDLKEDIDSIIAARGRTYGLRDISEITSSHPLTPVIEKQRQIMTRLDRVDRHLQPDSFAKMTMNIANDFVNSGEIDIAIPYYRATANTIYDSLGTAAKTFWNSEANAKTAIKAGFIADNAEVAHMGLNKLISAKAKSTNQEELKKIAFDYYHNLTYEYDRIMFGVKRYGNKNKELELLSIRKQQQYLSEKYQLKDDIESLSGKDGWVKMDEQANLTVEELLKNPRQMTEPDKFKRNERVPANTPSAMTAPSQQTE